MDKLDAIFSPQSLEVVGASTTPGNISFISQSEALCTAVWDFAADRDFGFSKFISIGNKHEGRIVLNFSHCDLIVFRFFIKNRKSSVINELRA